MQRKNQNRLCLALCLFAAFGLWTGAVCLMDKRAIGPLGSAVGLAAINQWVHNFTGVHMSLYRITDWLGLVPFVFASGFGVLGLVQWIKRKSIRRVDGSLLVLGGFYFVVILVYTFFEAVVVNYRPILIDGVLEASYPSSTTMLVLCVMPTAAMQCKTRIQSPILNRCILWLTAGFTIFMVIGRLISGVHWFSDIVGGILLSAGLTLLYASLCPCKRV